MNAPEKRAKRRRLFRLSLLLVALAAEVLVLVRRGYRPYGGRVRVRCRAGHEFSTLWIPGASVRSLRLGPWRLMRCRAGRHWSIVTLMPRGQQAPSDVAASAPAVP
jgi:hypothetical protein